MVLALSAKGLNLLSAHALLAASGAAAIVFCPTCCLIMTASWQHCAPAANEITDTGEQEWR